jgi:N-acetylglucosaminyldiphosphoundecaprenol N-acetyl-beta-D-mannosaminyltransferase
MSTQKILSIPARNIDKDSILEKISLFLNNPTYYLHIVSLNPENLVIAHHNDEFSKVLSEGDIQLFDGVGIQIGCAILGVPATFRLAGVDCMDLIIKTFSKKRLRVLFLGGKEHLAEKVAECYTQAHSASTYRGIEGISDISRPTKAEEDRILAIVADYKPQIIFAAFGSPAQELWFYRHKEKLQGIICMGVGGAFDFVTGAVPRAPRLLRQSGMEWLFRLFIQPWRLKRQLRLVEFVYLVFKQKFSRR